MLSIHIGKAIAQRISEVGMTKAEFGRRINTSRQNVNTLLRKESLDTAVLFRIGKVLHFDFLSLYSESKPSSTPKPALQSPFEVVIRVADVDRGKDLLALLNQSGFIP